MVGGDKRVRAIRRARDKCKQLVSMGLVPAGTWGDGVTGRSWSVVKALLRAVRAALFTHTSRRSLTIDLARVPGNTRGSPRGLPGESPGLLGEENWALERHCPNVMDTC